MEVAAGRESARYPVWILPFLLGLAASSPALPADLLVPRGAEWRYFRGTREASTPVEAWRRPGFDAAAWAPGSLPLRYGDGTGGTELPGMQDGYTSVFLRREFTVVDAAAVEQLRLGVDYDDGFIAWINGVEVERVNAPDTPTHDAVAPGNHESGTRELFLLENPGRYLRSGLNVNVIAIHAFNISSSSSDFLIDAELESVRVVADTRFSHKRGFHDAPFSVTVSTATPGATIRYTTDGSAPSPGRGLLYTGPVPIETTTVLRAMAHKEGMEPTNVDTQTYLFLDDVLEQPRFPPGFPTRWGELTADYAMDPQVVRAPRYRDRMRDALLAIPTLSIVMDRTDLFGAGGIYQNGGSGQNAGWERPASVEWIRPDGEEGFQIDCGIRPHSHVLLKRSFKLLFKSEYGDNKLRYPLFAEAPQNAGSAARKFDRLILRAGTNRVWSNPWNPDDTCYTRDQWARDSQIALSGAGSHGTFAHLYLDGLYWGLYNVVERPDAWFTSEYFGGEREDWYAVNHGGAIGGDASRYDRLQALAVERRLEETAKYSEFRGLLDVARYSDYIALNWYAGTGDWPNNNWYGGNPNRPAGPFQYYVWDAEDIFDALGSDRRGRSNDGAWVQADFRRGARTNRTIARIWHALAENSDFLTLFADRVYRACFNDGALTEANSRDRWLALNAFIETAVLGESARWGDSRESSGEPLRTPEGHWWPEVDRVSEVSLRENVGRFIGVLRRELYYPTIDPPVFDRHGGLVPPGSLASLSVSGGGTIYYSVDGSDPRLPGGNVNGRARTYREPIPIVEATTIRARRLSGSQWSALAEAKFLLPQDLVKLRITEIHYHPPAEGITDGDEFEFLELWNTGAEPLDLTGVHFSDGITHAFADGTLVGPGEPILLVSNRSEFSRRYPGVQVDGVYEKRLSNGGEIVTLADFSGSVIATVDYGDDPPWPVEADGDGHSLVPVSAVPGADQDDPAAWRRSTLIGGSPGAADGVALAMAPAVARDPESRDVLEGEPVLFTVWATAYPLPEYRWQRDGVDIPGATNWYLAIPSASLFENDARFRCRVTNEHGAVISGTASLSVRRPPVSGRLVDRGAGWRYFRGSQEPSVPLAAWRSESFNDASWQSGRAPFGYGDPPFQTTLTDMKDRYTTLFLRRRFTVPQDLVISELRLVADHDDGFIAWINGIEILRVNAPAGMPFHDSLASATHESGNYESFILESPEAYLRPGQNLLALQGFNVEISSSDFKLDVELAHEGFRVSPGEGVFTRGESNGDGRVDLSDVIHMLLVLFAGAPSGCEDARDANDDGRLAIDDPIHLAVFLFLQGPPPPAPFPALGVDTTPDALDCE